MVYLDVGGHVGHERFRKKASRKGVWGTRRRTFVLEAHLAAHLRDHTSHTSFFRGLRAATRSSYRGHAPPHIPHAVPKCPSLFGKRCASPAQCCPIGFRRSTLAAHVDSLYRINAIHPRSRYGILLLHITQARQLFYRAQRFQCPNSARWCYKCVDKNNKRWTDDAEIEAKRQCGAGTTT